MNSQVFPDPPIYDWKEILFAKLFGQRFQIECEECRTVYYVFKGRIYITEIEYKNKE